MLNLISTIVAVDDIESYEESTARIMSNDVFDVENLINKSQFELKLLGLQKVHDINKNWYVRTLKNNTKIDNLG
ncbi:hypothetical protein [Mycoplasma sp. 392]